MAELNIVSGNIFDYLDNKDLIVNSANQYMTYGSGLCGLIYKMADKDLLEDYCKKHALGRKEIIELLPIKNDEEIAQMAKLDDVKIITWFYFSLSF